MSHTANHTLLLTLGQLTGWLAIVIAVYLQWWTQERPPAIYFWGFLTFGMAFSFAHVGVFHPPWPVTWLAALGYLVVMGIVAFSGYWVRRRYNLDGMVESVNAAIKS